MNRPSRRTVLRQGLGALSAAAVGSWTGAEPAPILPLEPAPAGTPDEVARDEAYWARVRSAFRFESRYVWLSHGPGSAVPQAVLDRMKGYVDTLAHEPAHDAPAFRDLKESGSSQALRERMARTFGCDPAEIALTRNAMEGLATCLLGYDLKPGDEVLTTRLDYDACIAILRQRERRDGIRLKLVSIPAPAATAGEVVAAFEEAITPRTRMMLACHMLTGNGQVLPVRELAALARRRGILLVVDGAHSIGHLDFRLADLGCDCFAGSLHKWFLAPRGTGMLYIRRDRIKEIWPIFAPYSKRADTDIEKFEEVGTVSLAVPAVLPEVFDLHDALGARNKEARLRYLRDRWAEPLARHERVRFRTSFDPRWSCAMAGFTIQGFDVMQLRTMLREQYGLWVRSFEEAEQPEVKGINVGANVMNSLAEVDRLVAAIDELTRKGSGG